MVKWPSNYDRIRSVGELVWWPISDSNGRQANADVDAAVTAIGASCKPEKDYATVPFSAAIPSVATKCYLKSNSANMNSSEMAVCVPCDQNASVTLRHGIVSCQPPFRVTLLLSLLSASVILPMCVCTLCSQRWRSGRRCLTLFFLGFVLL